VDRLVLQRSNGRKRVPFVPGSQIKGVLRHRCERLAALLGGEVISPHVVSRPGQGGSTTEGVLQHFGPLARSDLLIDRLFGSRYQGECLFVEDALPAAESPGRIWPHSRTSIDRLTGTARAKRLFVSEVVEQPVLTGRLRARHPAKVLTQLENEFPYEYALLLTGLLDLDSLGGGRSSGLGQCRISISTLHWNDQRGYPLTEALDSFKDAKWLDWVVSVRKETV
jgi:CRISPR/Cas system CSM-associated protein Csm3 (group 7 of RAMP superfamily)